MTAPRPRPLFSALGWSLLPALWLGAPTPTSAASPPPPNVIIFLADDMGMGDTSAYQDVTGNPDADQLRTPAMARLAASGIRFTDAHTPSSRCSPTRYGLLTGRYPWRSRLKHFVLFGSQGDPTIEADRPTLATLFRDAGFRTGMVGKWHLGLRYTRSDGSPAAGFADADLTKPLADGPLDHGFEFARFTSRSHATSGPDPTAGKANSPDQDTGPGHIHGARVVSASGDGRRLVDSGPDAYRLHRLGSRHSDHAVQFIAASAAARRPFFLYYASNSNHSPYTADETVGGRQVRGAARSETGQPMGSRQDMIYENDVALGRLIDQLAATDDPRRPGHKLLSNTVVIFTSDNGAEVRARSATGPFRSNKGSAFEGGHRVPFLVAWPAGGVPAGATSSELINLVDLFATFAEILGVPLPDLRAGARGAEDSRSHLAAWRGEHLPGGRPQFYHDHKEADGDRAVSALRVDDASGQWKIFFEAALLRHGEARPSALYELSADPLETHDLLGDPEHGTRVAQLTATALLHRTAGGHRLAASAPPRRVLFDWRGAQPHHTATLDGVRVTIGSSTGADLRCNARGLGVAGGGGDQVDGGEALLLRFDRDVLVESVGVVAGNGRCGGFYRVERRDGTRSATADIYCTDAHIDSHDQSGLLSDIGVVLKGDALRLDSSPHHHNESPGRWRLATLSVRPLAPR